MWRLVENLNPETEKLLRRIQKESKHHQLIPAREPRRPLIYQVRQRAHCILLSCEGFTIGQLVIIFQVSRKTIYNWINAWLNNQLIGLYNQPERGRKQTFTSDQKE